MGPIMNLEPLTV